jgi:branched-chain amino acid transport system ATP-binding protein
MLKVEDLYACYGESPAVQGISFNVNKGEIVALLGRNGVGKSTTLKSIIGIVRPRKGKIFFKDYEIQNLPPYRIARLGIGYVPEDRRIFPSLTVLENLNLGVREDGGGWPLERIFEFFPRLKERLTHKGFELSGGEQQMLAIARVLRMKTELLLVDEPTEGLAPQLVKAIEEILREVKREGLTTILVEQNVCFVTSLADRVYVMCHGKIVYEGSKEEFLRAEEVIKLYLGV